MSTIVQAVKEASILAEVGGDHLWTLFYYMDNKTENDCDKYISFINDKNKILNRNQDKI